MGLGRAGVGVGAAAALLVFARLFAPAAGGGAGDDRDGRAPDTDQTTDAAGLAARASRSPRRAPPRLVTAADESAADVDSTNALGAAGEDPGGPEGERAPLMALDAQPTEALERLTRETRDVPLKEELVVELRARQDGLPALLALLEDEDPGVRLLSAEALEARLEPVVVGALRGRLAHERDEEVREALVRAVARERRTGEALQRR